MRGPGLDLDLAVRVDLEASRVRAGQRVGQRVAVAVRGGDHASDDVHPGAAVLRQGAGSVVCAERRRGVGERYDEDAGQGVVGIAGVLGVKLGRAYRAESSGAVVELSHPDGAGAAEGQCSAVGVKRLRSGAGAAGPDPPRRGGGAGAVPGVGLVVPGAVVEVSVVVGRFGAIQPVYGRGSVTGCGLGVVAGVRIGGAAEDAEPGAVVLDVGVAGGGLALDVGVVVRDLGGGRGVAGVGEEDEPEFVAGV